MSVASLLDPSGPSFAFDHMQIHQNMYQGTPASSGFSVLPYLLDPIGDVQVPAGWWNSDHAQAHSDFASAFPAIAWSSTVNINDINLSQGPDAWWALSNKIAHDLANTQLTGG
ncbi:MAG TPA: hypothetical protein VHT52_19360 [Stellaceae bacterium]|nr:hypothetical protein [Stellaceae bacterium]